MLMQNVRALVKDEDAATAVEYSLIAVAIAAVIVLVALSIGQKVLGLFQSAETGFPG